MFGFFRKNKSKNKVKTFHAEVSSKDGMTFVDVQGQNCPGFLLSINKALDALPPGTQTSLVTSYLASEEDIMAWAHQKGHTYCGSENKEGVFHISVRTKINPGGFRGRNTNSLSVNLSRG